MDIIQTDNLTKRFGSTIAVDSVSTSVNAGEIYGFLGLNGAGKTTTIRMLLGMIRPDKGSFTLFGKRARQASEIWNDVGYMVETPNSYPELTVKENLEIFCRLRNLDGEKPADTVIEKMHLSRYENVKVKHLSMGNKQRLGLAKALMHRPKLLILDEPVNGLDPAGIVEVRELLLDLSGNGNTTVFLSSHILSEIARLATRIGIIHEGKLIKEINAGELEKQIIKKLRINTADNGAAIDILKDKGVDVLPKGNNLMETSDQDYIEHPEKASEILAAAKLPPKMLYVFEEDLESYFLRTIGEKAAE